MPSPRWTIFALLLCAGCGPLPSATGERLLPDAPARPADLWLVVRVRDRLLATPGLSGIDRRVGLASLDGTVTLRGPWPGEARRQALVRAVRGVPGVLRVVDGLGSPGDRPPDEEDDPPDPPEPGEPRIVSDHTHTQE